MTASESRTVTAHGIFNMIDIVDDFGDKTGDKAVIGSFSGTFCNSAATDKNLDISVYFVKYEKGEVVIVRLYEYGKYKVNYLGDEDVTLKMKLPDGNVKKYKLEVATSTDEAYCMDEELIYDIRNCSEIKCNIEISHSSFSSYRNEYNFSIRNDGLDEVYPKM